MSVHLHVCVCDHVSTFVPLYVNMSVSETIRINGHVSKDKHVLLRECICFCTSHVSVCVSVGTTIVCLFMAVST